MVTGEQAIKILKELKESAETIDKYEDDVIADYRDMAEYEKREIIGRLLSLDLE